MFSLCSPGVAIRLRTAQRISIADFPTDGLPTEQLAQPELPREQRRRSPPNSSILRLHQLPAGHAVRTLSDIVAGAQPPRDHQHSTAGDHGGYAGADIEGRTGRHGGDHVVRRSVGRGYHLLQRDNLWGFLYDRPQPTGLMSGASILLFITRYYF